MMNDKMIRSTLAIEALTIDSLFSILPLPEKEDERSQVRSRRTSRVLSAGIRRPPPIDASRETETVVEYQHEVPVPPKYVPPDESSAEQRIRKQRLIDRISKMAEKNKRNRHVKSELFLSPHVSSLEPESTRILLHEKAVASVGATQPSLSKFTVNSNLKFQAIMNINTERDQSITPILSEIPAADLSNDHIIGEIQNGLSSYYRLNPLPSPMAAHKKKEPLLLHIDLPDSRSRVFRDDTRDKEEAAPPEATEDFYSMVLPAMHHFTLPNNTTLRFQYHPRPPRVGSGGVKCVAISMNKFRDKKLQEFEKLEQRVKKTLVDTLDFHKIQQRRYSFLAIITVVTTMRVFASKLDALSCISERFKYSHAIMVLQRSLFRRFKLYKARKMSKYWGLLLCSFIVAWRYRRMVRNTQANVLRKYLLWSQKDPLHIVHVFYLRIKICQKIAHDYLNRRRCQRLLILLQFERIESNIFEWYFKLPVKGDVTANARFSVMKQARELKSAILTNKAEFRNLMHRHNNVLYPYNKADLADSFQKYSEIHPFPTEWNVPWCLRCEVILEDFLRRIKIHRAEVTAWKKSRQNDLGNIRRNERKCPTLKATVQPKAMASLFIHALERSLMHNAVEQTSVLPTDYCRQIANFEH